LICRRGGFVRCFFAINAKIGKIMFGRGAWPSTREQYPAQFRMFQTFWVLFSIGSLIAAALVLGGIMAR
jgi:hypothetical protein